MPASRRAAVLAAGLGLGAAAALLWAAPALADPLGAGSSLGAPATAPAGRAVPVQASLVEVRGALFPPGVPVIFSQLSGPAPACVARFDPQFAVTGATGQASATVTLPPGCPGRFVLQATAAGSGSVTAQLVETGGRFPDTSAEPPPPAAGSWWVAAGAVLLLAPVVACLLRRS